MYCGQCGCKCDDNAKFCPRCGNALAGSTPVNTNSQTQQPYGQTGNPWGARQPYNGSQGSEQAWGQNAQAQQTQLSVQPQRNTWQQADEPQRVHRNPSTGFGAPDTVLQFCSGGSVLGFVLVLTAQVLISLLANFSSSLLTGFFSFIGSIPMIIICIGTWITCFGARNGGRADTGLTMISGGLLTIRILYDIVFAVLILLMLFAISQTIGYSSSEANAVTGLLIVFLIVLAVALALVNMFYGGLRTPVLSARNILRNGSGTWKISFFSLVLLILSAVSSLFSLMGTLLVSGISNQFWYEIRSALYSTGVFSNSDINTILSLLGVSGSRAVLSTFSSILTLAVLVYAFVLLFCVNAKKKVIG